MAMKVSRYILYSLICLDSVKHKKEILKFDNARRDLKYPYVLVTICIVIRCQNVKV